MKLEDLLGMPWKLQKWHWDNESERWSALRKHYDNTAAKYPESRLDWLLEPVSAHESDIRTMLSQYIQTCISRSVLSNKGNDCSMGIFRTLPPSVQVWYIDRENKRWTNLQWHYANAKPHTLLWLKAILDDRSTDIDKLENEWYRRKGPNLPGIVGVKPLSCYGGGKQ